MVNQYNTYIPLPNLVSSTFSITDHDALLILLKAIMILSELGNDGVYSLMLFDHCCVTLLSSLCMVPAGRPTHSGVTVTNNYVPASACCQSPD